VRTKHIRGQAITTTTTTGSFICMTLHDFSKKFNPFVDKTRRDKILVSATGRFDKGLDHPVGYSWKIWVGLRGALLQTLPYFGPKNVIFPTLFQT